MGAYDAWRKFMAVKAHFERPKYDCFNCNFKLPYTHVKAYEKRTDKWIWHKLDTRIDATDFMVSHALLSPATWIGEACVSPEFETLHGDRLRRVHGLSYFLKQDIAKLDPEKFDGLFRIEKHQHPLLLKKLWGGEIFIETASVLVRMSGCAVVWNELGDSTVKKQTLRVIKYLPFLQLNEDKARNILLAHFTG